MQPIKQANGHDCGVIMIDTARQLASDNNEIMQKLKRRDLRNEFDLRLETRGGEFWYPRFDTDIRMSGGGFGILPQRKKKMKKTVAKRIYTALAPINCRIEEYLRSATKGNKTGSQASEPTTPQEAFTPASTIDDIQQNNFREEKKGHSVQFDAKPEGILPKTKFRQQLPPHKPRHEKTSHVTSTTKSKTKENAIQVTLRNF